VVFLEGHVAEMLDKVHDVRAVVHVVLNANQLAKIQCSER
jgi:hypothetical protein